ncbi:MAG: AMP-binding protein [Actinomycetota bacterium]|nr:AMP-binding protein [Actinomycetota bacterium]
MRTSARLALCRSRDLTLGTLLEQFAGVRAERPLVEEPDGWKLTYAEAADLVARAGATVAGRVDPGDRVVVTTPNGYRMFLAAAAVARAGAVAVPVNPRMKPDEIDYVVADAGARLRIDDFDELVEASPGPAPAVAVDPSDIAVLFYTSGTTGRPKGAELSHRALIGAAHAGALVPEGIVAHGCVTGMPVAHVAGFAGLIMFAATGIPLYLLTHFRPDDALDAIESRRAMMFLGVPAMYRMLLEAGAESRDLSSVRLWSSGADALPLDIVERFQRMGGGVGIPGLGRTLGKATFVDGYGMVELGGGVAVRVFAPVPLPMSGALRPVEGHEFRIADEHGLDVPRGVVGELLIKGPNVMRGYHGRDDATAEAFTADGWLRTGDLARARGFGFFELTGRKKDVVKHGGYSVFPVEVERVLEEHPAVAEAAVLGIADETKGEVPVAAVRLNAGATLGEAELCAFAAERLSDYKVPKRVVVVDELPRTGTEKVRKADLRPLFT